MKRLIGLLLIFNVAFAYAQVRQTDTPAGSFGATANEPQVGFGKLSGKVLDPDGEPVPFATIALVNSETQKTVDGTIADENGDFLIKSIPAGKYLVNISFIGFEKIEKSPYVFTGKGETFDLGAVSLAGTTQELDEVVVEGQRDLFEEKVDRIVYNAEQDKTTMGGDASDVLRRVPLLNVDLDGNVSLRGSSNIIVLIDNRPSTISASSIADALKQIPADQIKSVEVITSPSAKYDAEGTGGIINIITKKNNLQGTSVNLNTGAGLRGSNLGLNASLRKGRMGVTLGGFGRAGYNIAGEFQNSQVIKDASTGDILSVTNQFAESSRNQIFGRYNLGLDYELNKYNWVAASVRWGISSFSNDQDNRLSETYVDDNLVSSRLQDSETDNSSNTVDLSLNYIKTFEKQGKEINLLSLYSQNTRISDFENSSLDPTTEDIISRQKNDNTSYNKELTFQADFIEPFGDNHILEVGAKSIMRVVTSDYKYFTDNGDGNYVPVTDRGSTNVFDYNQNVTAGYVAYTANLTKGFSAKVGARYEYTTIQANFENESELGIPSYGVLVPSINLSKKLGMGNTIKLAYSRRIQRPSLRFLNPNVDSSNPLNISQGNPNLDPEFTDTYELTYSTFKGGASLNFSAFMRNTNGSIQQVREILGQDTVFTSFRNIGEEDAYGLSVFANVRIGDKLMLNGGFDSYYAVLENNVPDPIYNASNQGFVISGRVFGSYKFAKEWAFQFFTFMRGNQVQLQGNQTGFYMYSLGINHSFNEERGSIGIGAENFLTKEMKMTSEVNSPIIDQYNTNVMRNMNFKINFQYKFGKLSVSNGRKKDRSIKNNDLKSGEDSDFSGGDGATGGAGFGNK